MLSMIRRSLLVSLLILCVTGSPRLWAADGPEAQQSGLETITVIASKLRSFNEFTPTGSRLGLSALETPGSLDVIDSDEMIGRGYSSVEQAADSLPGVTSGGSPGDLEQFSMRGFTGDQIVSLLENLDRRQIECGLRHPTQSRKHRHTKRPYRGERGPSLNR